MEAKLHWAADDWALLEIQLTKKLKFMLEQVCMSINSLINSLLACDSAILAKFDKYITATTEVAVWAV